jgi:hypothetical protein
MINKMKNRMEKNKLITLKSPPRYENIHIIKLINNANGFFKNKQGDLKRIIYVLIFVFMFYSLFLSVLPSENILCFVSAANECTGNDGDIGTTQCTAYGGCNGGPAWSIGGDVDTTTCCGDDSNNHVNTESSSTDAPAGYNDGITACCNVATDCNYNDACVATTGVSATAIPSKAYCISEVWYGGDYSSAACTAITGNASDWISTGTAGTSKCCGDDGSTEDFESTSGAGNKLCYNDNVMHDADVSGSILNHNGTMFDCGNQASDESGLATTVTAGSCTSYESLYCQTDNTWGALLPDGCACTANGQCTNYCDAENTANEGLSGLEGDDLVCFSAAACTSGSNCGSEDGSCQVDAGADADCDDYDDSTCLINAYCDSACGYGTLSQPTSFDGEVNQSYDLNTGMGSINLSWTDNSNGESNFTIYRSTDNSSFIELVNTTNNPYYDLDILDNTLYFYNMSAAYQTLTCFGATTNVVHNITADRTAPESVRLGLYERDVVLAYDFDENSSTTVVDKSAFGNDGENNGATWVENSGYRNGGIVFNGSTGYYLTILDDSTLNLDIEFTVSGWFKRDQSGIYDYIYSSGSNTNQWYLSISNTDKLRFTEDAILDYEANTAITDTEWHHFTILKDGDDGDNVIFYLDGVYDGNASVGTVATPSGVKYIGRRNQGGAYNGTLDEIRIYDKALTAEEVSLSYNQTKENVTNNYVELSWTDQDVEDELLLYMPFEEGSGTETKDWSDNKNDGILENSPSWTTGKYGNAIDFDGSDDYINISKVSNEFNPYSGTITAWINSIDAASPFEYIFDINGNTSGNYISLRFRSDGYSRWDFTYRANGNSEILEIAPELINKNQWEFITFTWDLTDDKVILYLNGITMGESNSLQTWVGSINSAIIGADTSGSNSFNGTIDEVHIYNRSLSQREIIDIMQSGLSKKTLFRATTEFGSYSQISGGQINSTNYTDATATDIADPNEATSLTSTSHSTSEWSNDNTVDLSWATATDEYTTYWFNISAIDAEGNYNSTYKNATVRSGLDGYDILCDTDSGELASESKDYEESQTTHTCTFSDGSSNYYHIKSVDNAGNWDATSADIGPFYIDTAGPSACTVDVIDSDSAFSYVSGTTVYYNTVTTGSFTINVTATDATSGISNVTFPATVSSGTIDTTANYQNTYNWATDDTFSSVDTVTCDDDARNTDTGSFTVTRDVTNPSGGSITYNDEYYTSLNIALTYSTGIDAGAGLNSSSGRILRKSATLANNVCGGFGNWGELVSEIDGSYADTSVTNGKCYQYLYEVFDNVHNGINYTSSNIAKVDSTNPVCSITYVDESINGGYQYISWG